MSKKFKIENEHFHSYLCLSIVSLISDILIVSIVWILYWIVFNNGMLQYPSVDIVVCIILTLLYVIYTLLVNHRILLLLFVDKTNKDIIEETIIPLKLELKKPWKSYQIMNNVSILYPKELNVNKYNLIYLTGNKKFKIRLIMSQKKQLYTYDNILNNPKIKEIKIKYYKRSKMLISIELPNNSCCTIEDEKIIHKFNTTL